MANIFSQNAAWVASKKSIHGPDFFKNQIANHHPTYLWIGCSDARVPANEIMGEDVWHLLRSALCSAQEMANIFSQNAAWVASKKSIHGPDFFKNQIANHHPTYLWIGCSDARVPANEIMGEDTGSVFVVRNVANMVIGTDFNAMSAIQFAVDYLEVPHIIVCGHYDCGGVRASTQHIDHKPPLENWLRSIRDVYRLHQKELDKIKDEEKRHRRLVELNVVEQCINLFKTGVIQRKRVETFKDEEIEVTLPRIHAVVFDPETGVLNKLNVDFKQYINELHDIYDLYKPETEGKTGEGAPHAPGKA